MMPVGVEVHLSTEKVNNPTKFQLHCINGIRKPYEKTTGEEHNNVKKTI